MEEIIAKKYNGTLVGYIVIAIIGAVMLAMGIILISGDESGYVPMAIFAFVVAALMLGIAIWQLVVFFRTPKNVVTYKDGTLYFPRGLTCTPAELTSCVIHVTRSRYGVVSKHGAIVVTINGKKHKYSNIADVKTVQQRFGELNHEFVQQQAMQNYAAPAQPEAPAGTDAASETAAETKPDTDPFDL